jgi:uncharacterized protein (DUF2147 family)
MILGGGIMRTHLRPTLGGLLALAVLALTPATAAELKDMIGKWQWTDYIVEVKECTTNPSGAGLCATVIAGPKNVGLEMITSKLEKRSEVFVGQIAHPATSEIYNTKMTLKDPHTWGMDGCTAANVCATGDFKRIK